MINNNNMDNEQKNVAVYFNRYKDKITFEHIDDTVIMTGGSWFRYGLSNDYSKAYYQYVMDGGHEKIEVFEKLVHEYDQELLEYTELAQKYQKLVFSTNDISMVDPSGGPYISLGDNLKIFWPKGKYQDLIVESIKMAAPTKDTDEDNQKSVVIFKIK